MQGGFTLVEMIVVMVITGIIGGMVAIFIRAPVQGYVDSARRAEMTDIADTALRRLGRDIRKAVPNSVRVPSPTCIADAATPCYVEFIPTKAGGRYRAAPATIPATACGNNVGAVLNFDAPDDCFEIIGSPITFVTGDQVVVGSTQSDGNPPYQAPTAATGIRRPISEDGVGEKMQVVRMTSTTKLPAFAELSTQRFDVVDGAQQAVTYGCSGASVNASGNGTGTLTRYWNYNFITSQPTPPIGGATAILADNLSACEITYDLVNQRNGLVAIRLGITRGGESVSLYHTIHVNNVP